jgi:hypothetical protein
MSKKIMPDVRRGFAELPRACLNDGGFDADAAEDSGSCCSLLDGYVSNPNEPGFFD